VKNILRFLALYSCLCGLTPLSHADWGGTAQAIAEDPDGGRMEDDQGGPFMLIATAHAEFSFEGGYSAMADASYNGPILRASTSAQVASFTGVVFDATSRLTWNDTLSIFSNNPVIHMGDFECSLYFDVHGTVGAGGSASYGFSVADSDPMDGDSSGTERDLPGNYFDTFIIALSPSEISHFLTDGLDLTEYLNTHDQAGVNSSILESMTDFHDTANLTSITFRDNMGNLITDVTVTGESGISYPIDAVVPEPSTIALCLSGGLLAALVRIRRRRSLN
jgi:PEP-CTERM motif